MKNNGFLVDGGNENYKITLESRFIGDDIEIVDIRIVFPGIVIPEKIYLTREEEMTGIVFAGHPCCGRDFSMHQRWCASTSTSRFGFGAPLLYTVGTNGENCCTVAVSDASAPLSIKFWVDDFSQKFKVKYQIILFDGGTEPIGEYAASVRLDKRKIPYYEALADVYPWWRKNGYLIPEAPHAAKDALYSSWYNFHQMPESKALLEDLKIASELGFKTVIIDDGWQFEGEPEGPFYSKCGDWIVAKDKFPDFAQFVRDVHSLGMKLLLWFAVPFIGPETKIYESFKDKLLYYRSDKAFVADPRYAEVRKYITDTYCRFLLEYDIDGFKLDFVDSIRATDETPPYNSAMDYVTVDEAVKALLTEIAEETAKIKPQLLFEYRQSYVGPAINTFGNMLRVGDCAYDSLTNKIMAASLRLLGYPVAVHSDMLYWAREESISLCAYQLLNIMFSVPQISVILADSTQEQRALIKYFLSYWNENKDILLNGKFIPLHPENNFTSITAEGKDKQITVLYSEVPFVCNGKCTDVFNNSDTDGIILENPESAAFSGVIYDCFGTFIERLTVAPNSIIRADVPVRGMLALR